MTGPVPDGDHLVPLGVAEVKRAGTDVTIVGLAYYVHEALAVAEELAREGISVEVVDPRTLVPLDVETVRASVRKTGRVVIVDEAPATCSAASEIAALHRRGPRDVSRPEGPRPPGLRRPRPRAVQPAAGAGRPAEPGRHQGGRLRGAEGVPAPPVARARPASNPCFSHDHVFAMLLRLLKSIRPPKNTTRLKHAARTGPAIQSPAAEKWL